MIEEGEGLVTLVTARSAFEAHTIVALLDDEGIEAFAIDPSPGGFGFSIEPYHREVEVQVRASDLANAQTTLGEHQSEAGKVDWERLEVGEREDELKLHRPGRMPLLAKIAWVVTLVVLLAGTFGVALLVIWPMFF